MITRWKTLRARANEQIAGALICVGLLLCVYSANQVFAKSSDGDVHGAWAYTQLFVERKLEPRPADFRFGGYRDVEFLGDSKYKFDSYVDTKNQYDAKVRVRFKGEIERVDGGWRMNRLSFYK